MGILTIGTKELCNITFILLKPCGCASNIDGSSQRVVCVGRWRIALTRTIKLFRMNSNYESAFSLQNCDGESNRNAVFIFHCKTMRLERHCWNALLQITQEEIECGPRMKNWRAHTQYFEVFDPNGGVNVSPTNKLMLVAQEWKRSKLLNFKCKQFIKVLDAKAYCLNES